MQPSAVLNEEAYLCPTSQALTAQRAAGRQAVLIHPMQTSTPEDGPRPGSVYTQVIPLLSDL